MRTAEPQAPPRRVGRVRLVDLDPDLAQRPAGNGTASQATVTVVEIPAEGSMLGSGIFASERGGLVLRGILLRTVETVGHSITEMLGPGDVIAGGDPDDDMGAGTVTWRPFERTLVADLASVEGADRYAEIALLESITRRLEIQLARASMRGAITSLIRVDLRLLAYLWHLADSFGVVTTAGVKLDLPLTHALVAQLIGARRPTVTTAFGVLADEGYVERDGRAIILIGDRASALERATSN